MNGRLSWPRSVLLSVSGCVVALSLAGCSPEFGAVSGLSVDASGRPIGLLLTCSRDARLDVALLQDYTVTATPSTVGEWTAKTALTGTGSVNLSEPGPGWSTKTQLGTLVDGRRYVISWLSTSNRWASEAVSFTVADLAKIPPGQVRFVDSVSADRITPHYRVATMADFQGQECVIRQ